MEFVNRTAFRATVFRQFDRQGGLDAVVAVRGTFDVVPGGMLQVAAEQEAFQWQDTYDGDPQTAPLIRQGDLVPFKPGTDVTMLADAHCPEAAGAPAWTCGLRILGASGAVLLDKQVRVTGPRQWQPKLRSSWRALAGGEAAPTLLGWSLTAPTPVRRVALDWRLAHGGPLPGEISGNEPVEVHLANPVGIGMVGRMPPPSGQPVPAPQVERLDTEIGDWRADPAPAGLGPLSPHWQLRQRFVGTYDQAWLDTRHPLLPEDFDERFWQCAPPDQVVVPWLRGTERYEVLNLHADHPRLSGTLPGIMLGLTVQRPGVAAERATVNLDGVHFDLRPDWERVVLTWRVRLPLVDGAGVCVTLAERMRVANTVAMARAEA